MGRLRLEEIEDLAFRALVASRTRPDNARSVAASIRAAEADGIASHGLLRVPTYCTHARSGKVDGFAEAAVSEGAPALLLGDARNGFAHPAIERGLDALMPLARRQGVAALAIRRSYNSGVMGHHVERCAREGLVALGFANAPAVIAPWGGTLPLFGTNPIAFAAPRAGRDPVVIDQASSVVARGEVMLRAKRGEAIPDAWGLDSHGRPTTDPKEVLEGGSMAPAGGYKGATIAMMVELLAAALTGALPSSEAGSLTGNDTNPAGVGQLFIACDPGKFGVGFAARVEALCAELSRQPGARVPGARRFAARRQAAREGVEVDDGIRSAVEQLAR